MCLGSTPANRDRVLPQEKVFGKGNGMSLCSFLIDKCTDSKVGDKLQTKINLLF